MVVYIKWDTTQPYTKNKILLFASTWLDLEDIVLSEICQTGKDEHFISFICGIEKKIHQASEFKKEVDSQIENKLVITSGERELGREIKGQGSTRYKF